MIGIFNYLKGQCSSAHVIRRFLDSADDNFLAGDPEANERGDDLLTDMSRDVKAGSVLGCSDHRIIQNLGTRKSHMGYSPGGRVIRER